MEQSQNSPTTEQGRPNEASTFAGDVKEKVSGALTSARGATGNMQASLADALESGAASLRQRTATLADGASTNSASGGAAGSEAQPKAAVQGALAAVAPRAAETGAVVASLMERGAMWLRETDLTDLEGHVKTQVKQYPMRTLAIAAGIGLLLARRRD